MLARMDRLLITLALTAVTSVTACAPVASAPSATPSAVPSSAAPTAATAPSAPTPSAVKSGTPIPLPTGAQIAAAGGGVVWMYVNGDHLFRSLDRGDTWSERTLASTIATAHQIAFISDRVGWFVIGFIAVVLLANIVDGWFEWRRRRSPTPA